MLEGWSVLAALARETKTVRLGTLVTGVTYRNPALLAKTATTLDVISGGRAIFGLGAAWFEAEHEAFGFEFPPISERMDRLDEALTIVRGDVRPRALVVRGPPLPHRRRDQRPAAGPAGRPADHGRRRRRAADAADRGQARGPHALVPAGPGRPAAARPTCSYEYCEAIGRDPGDDRADDGRPGHRRGDRGRGQGHVGADPGGAARDRRLRRARRAAEALQPYLDAGFTGFTFNNTLYRTTDQIAALGEVLRQVAASPREAVPVPRRARRRRRRPVARRGRPPRRVDRLLGGSSTPTTSCCRSGSCRCSRGPRPPPSGCGSCRSSPTTTCGTRRCSPRTSRRSTCSAAGRVEVAIGAGWNRPEYDAHRASRSTRSATRVGRLTEAVAVLKGCFGDGPFSFAGEHYTITEPRRAARSRSSARIPPLFIGGGGKRVLTLAGREADIVSLAPRTLTAAVGRGGPLATRARSRSRRPRRRSAGSARPPATGSTSLELNVYPTGVAPAAHRPPAQGRRRRARRDPGAHGRRDRRRRVPRVAARVHRLGGRARRRSSRSCASGSASARIMVGDLDTLAPVVERLAGT